MGDPTYEAIRARQRAEAAKVKAQDDAAKAAADAFIAFFNGKARLEILPPLPMTRPAWQVRFVRDEP
jgi:hypothetical protein